MVDRPNRIESRFAERIEAKVPEVEGKDVAPDDSDQEEEEDEDAE